MALVISEASGNGPDGPYNYINAAAPQITFSNNGTETCWVSTNTYEIPFGSFGIPIYPGKTLQLQLTEDTTFYFTRGRVDVVYYEQEL